MPQQMTGKVASVTAPAAGSPRTTSFASSKFRFYRGPMDVTPGNPPDAE